jgi:hypothetical protein
MPGSPRSGFIAVLDSDMNLIKLSDPIEYFAGVGPWLPDGSGVMFHRSGDLGSLPPLSVLDLKQRMVGLPFEMDRVLALIP